MDAREECTFLHHAFLQCCPQLDAPALLGVLLTGLPALLLAAGGPACAAARQRPRLTRTLTNPPQLLFFCADSNDAKNGANALNWFPCTSASGWQDCSWVGGDNYT